MPELLTAANKTRAWLVILWLLKLLALMASVLLEGWHMAIPRWCSVGFSFAQASQCLLATNLPLLKAVVLSLC